MLGLDAFLYVIFIGVAWIMTIYTLNFYYLSYQSQHNVIHQKRKDKLNVLVDSEDDTFELVQLAVGEQQLRGFNIRHYHRISGRAGYKAGALREGMKCAKGEFIAIFD